MFCSLGLVDVSLRHACVWKPIVTQKTNCHKKCENKQKRLMPMSYSWKNRKRRPKEKKLPKSRQLQTETENNGASALTQGRLDLDLKLNALPLCYMPVDAFFSRQVLPSYWMWTPDATRGVIRAVLSSGRTPCHWASKESKRTVQALTFPTKKKWKRKKTQRIC